MISWEADTDVVVVGSGAAGLTVALDAAAAGLSVLVVTKGSPNESNTSWAQGGIAVVRAERDLGDSVGAHIEDTLVAAAGLGDPLAIAAILGAGAGAFGRLLARGASFDSGPNGLQRTREGGHCANRVVHAGGDATGAEIERALLAAPGRPAILAGHVALDVATDAAGAAAGITVLDDDGMMGLIRSRAVVLATGGIGHVYSATTNPAVATADGLAMALRAGAELADVEFVQFHPTVLWTGPGARGHRPLVTEAVRGEGAVLIDATGARVMTGVHPLEDLAPRDVVSLAITRRLAGGPGGVYDHVYLDATGFPPGLFGRRFPTVSAACSAAGIDPARQPIPVAPAAHYHCGGIITDLDGRTSVDGLFAVGEVARTGLHGANRLASNSLLESLVMAERAAHAVLSDPAVDGRRLTAAVVHGRFPGGVRIPLFSPAAGPGRSALQVAMSGAAGVGRDEAGLRQALALAGPISPIHPTGGAPSARLDRGRVEAANLALTSAALLSAALARQESRGCHVRTDFPTATDNWSTNLVVRLTDRGLSVETVDLRQMTAHGPVEPVAAGRADADRVGVSA